LNHADSTFGCEETVKDLLHIQHSLFRKRVERKPSMSSLSLLRTTGKPTKLETVKAGWYEAVNRRFT
jgi:hypothetical protein